MGLAALALLTMAFSAQQNAFISTLAARTGLNPGVVAAWVASEEPVGATSGYHGTQDWLNVGITDSGPMGAGNSVWRNPVQAANATAAWIKGQWSDPGFGKASSGIQAIMRTAGGSPGAQIQAIRSSGWASSGYPNMASLYQQFAGFRPGAAGAPSSLPGGSSGSSGSTVVGTLPGLTQQVPTFDQAGFGKAAQAYKLGTIMKMLGSVSSGLDTGPKLDIGPSAMTGLYEKGLISNTAPNPQDFQGMKTVSIAHKATLALQGMAGTGLVNTHPGAAGYVNPIPGAVIGRTDMGVDINLKPGAPVRAIGDSKVLGIIPNWYAGQPYYAFKLLNGPQAGHVYYVAEQFSPHVRPGQTVRRGQTIGTYASHGTGIEIGWASPTNWQQTLAQATGNTGDASHNNAPAGVNFRSFLGGLGV